MKLTNLLLIVAVFCVVTEVEARKNPGNVRFSNRAPKVRKIYQHPEWMDEMALFMDSIFDWFGYHEIPHTMRYSICLTVLFIPVYALFFFYCIVHEDEHDDPEEQMQFKERVEIAYQRK